MIERIKSWFSREGRKLTSGTPREAGWYVWTYYRYWILGIVAVLGVLIFLAVRAVTVPGENWFFACFPNTYADLGRGSDFYEDFVEYAGYDLDEKNLEFNASIYCKPSGRTFGNAYYETLISYLDSGALDVLVMEREDIEALGDRVRKVPGGRGHRPFGKPPGGRVPGLPRGRGAGRRRGGEPPGSGGNLPELPV